MKSSIALLVVLLCTLLGVNPAHATAKYWAAVGCGGGGGGGFWEKTGTYNYWRTDNETSCPGTTTWASGDDAVFGGTAGTVTLIATPSASPFNVNSIKVDTGGYKFTMTLTATGNWYPQINGGHFTVTTGTTQLLSPKSGTYLLLNVGSPNFILYVDGAGTLDFNNPTYTGVNNILRMYITGGGTLILRGGNAEPGGNAADYYKLDGGSTLYLLGYNASYTTTYGGLTVGPGGGNIQVDSTKTATFSVTTMAGTGILGATGAGTLTFNNANTGFTGGLAANAGTLKLGSGAMTALTSVSIGAGGTLDVSLNTPTYTLPSGASFSASGAASAATIKGATTVSLGSRPITLAYDGSHAALTVSQGALTLNQNAFTVNSASPLASGTYAIATVAGGTINSTTPYSVTGTAIGTGKTASIQVSGGNVNLVIMENTVTGLARTTGASPQTYGSTLTFTATVSGNGTTPGGNVIFKDGSTTLATVALASGSAAYTSYTDLNVSGSPHSIAAYYQGDTTHNTSDSSASPISQSITLATLDVSANGTLVYGRDPTNAVYTPVYYPLQGTDTVSVVSGSADFSTDATAASYVGDTYTVTTVGTAGLSAQNYSFAAGTNGIMTVTLAPLTVTNATASDKVYDGNTTATINTGAAGLDGLVNGDEAFVTLDSSVAAGTFDTKNVGTGKTVTFTGFATLGDLGTNYTVTQPTTTASIFQTNITVTAAANTKTYDGTTNAAATPTITAGGIQAGDSAPTWTETYDTKNVGSGKTLTPAGVVGDDNGGANYNYTYATVSTGVINQTNLTVTAAANAKTYDGTTNAAATPTVTAGAIQTGDSAPAWTETYDTRNVGTGKTLTPAGTVNDGNGGANYNMTFTPVTTGVINQTNLTVTAADNTKTYDGTTSATNTPTITSGSIQTGDTAPAWMETYDNANVGTGKTLTPAGTVLDGHGGANYDVTLTPVVTGVITALTSSTVLLSSVNPSEPGSNVTFTAAVSAGVGTPGGDVVFLASGVPFSTNTLVNGTNSASTASLPLGTNTVAAQYAAQGNYLASSDSLDQVVKVLVPCSQTNAIVGIADNLDGTFTITVIGTPQAQYYVVASPDVTAAMNTWTPLPGSTNTAPDPSGQWSFIVTNAAPQYYRSTALNPCP